MKKVIIILSVLLMLAGCAGTKEAENTEPEAFSAEELYHLGLEALETKEYDKALDYLLKSAEAGSILAYYDIGLMYYNGEGVEVDETKALEYFEKGAEKGDADAVELAGWCYEQGIGTEANPEKALEYYEKGAAMGQAGCMTRVGWFYEKGIVVEENLSKAMEYYLKAADNGNAWAQCIAGYYYLNGGEGVEEDHEKAYQLFTKSAESGYLWSNYYLACMYNEGIYVDKSVEKAKENLEKAIENNDEDIIETIKGDLANGYFTEDVVPDSLKTGA